jgi:CheY-like chemotaxis protein
MSFRALLVTKDGQAVEVLTPALSNFGLSTHHCSYPDALCLVTEQKFHAIIVDFDDPHSAALVFENLSAARFHSHAVTVALLTDRAKVRHAFGHGANFVLYKPVDSSQAESTLRAAASLIRNERRTSFRVSVQVPVRLTCDNETEAIDGILLDLSEEGMDVLASQPLYCSAVFSLSFTLPNLQNDLVLRGEVVWANPNGESGIRFANVPEDLRSTLRGWLQNHSKPTLPPEPTARPDCKLTDLSLGGCYLETPSPFPEKTGVLVKMRIKKIEVQFHGVVRVMHPCHGMGIEFSNLVERRSEIEDLIRSLAKQRGKHHELSISPTAAPSEQRHLPRADFDDPLLDLLRNHESLTQERFLETLRSQRKGHAARA